MSWQNINNDTLENFLRESKTINGGFLQNLETNTSSQFSSIYHVCPSLSVNDPRHLPVDYIQCCARERNHLGSQIVSMLFCYALSPKGETDTGLSTAVRFTLHSAFIFLYSYDLC